MENAIKLSSKLNTAWGLADYTNKQKNKIPFIS